MNIKSAVTSQILVDLIDANVLEVNWRDIPEVYRAHLVFIDQPSRVYLISAKSRPPYHLQLFARAAAYDGTWPGNSSVYLPAFNGIVFDSVQSALIIDAVTRRVDSTLACSEYAMAKFFNIPA